MSRPVAIVSGGSRGLGAALVQRFLEDGHAVGTFARAETDRVAGWREQFGDRFLFRTLDGADPAALEVFFDAVLGAFGGRVDVLVNNAARVVDGILTMIRAGDVEATIALNLGLSIHLTQLASRAMLRQRSGSIVNVSSVNALRGHAGTAVYSATKAALDGLTRSLARELGPKNIRVNSVAPGFFESEMVAGLDADARARIARRTPLGRLASTRDVTEAVRWLCSESASFVTGHVLVVDGGLTC